MKLGSLLLRVAVVVAIAAGVGQWWLLREANLSAQRLIRQWEPYGQLRYERLWVNLWGTGRVWNLSFQPTGMTQATLGTPLDYQLRLRELRIHDFHLAGDGSLDRVRASLEGLSLPVATDYRSADKPALPTFSDLGYRQLDFNFDVELRVVPEAKLVLIDATGVGDQLARLGLKLQLEADGRRARYAPDQIGLRRLELDYADAGLMQRYYEVMASRLRVSPQRVPDVLIADLDRRAAKERWRWDAESAMAVRSFIRNPRQGHLLLDPPGEVVMRNLRLYAFGDWPQLLGFRFTAGETPAAD